MNLETIIELLNSELPLVFSVPPTATSELARTRNRQQSMAFGILCELCLDLAGRKAENLGRLASTVHHPDPDRYRSARENAADIFWEEHAKLYSLVEDALFSPQRKAPNSALYLVLAFQEMLLIRVALKLNPVKVALPPPSAFVYSMQ